MNKIIFCIALLFASLGTSAQDSIFIDFESKIDTSIVKIDASSIWQVCSPDKSFFNSAFSGEKCISTDSINAYPTNNQSEFTLKVDAKYFDASKSYFSFRHKFDTDSLNDFGDVFVSYDLGNSWTSLKDSTGSDLFSEGYWEHVFFNETKGGNPNFTGNTNEWILSRYIWIWHTPVKSASLKSSSSIDYLLLKFVFKSDNQSEDKEGWIIDDIKFGKDFLNSVSNTYFKEAKIYPNPTNGVFELSEVDKSAEYVAIYNSTGVLIKEVRITNSTNNVIDLSSYPSGLYYGIIPSKKGETTRFSLIKH